MLRAGRKSRSVNRPHFNWIFCQQCLSSIYRTKMATSNEWGSLSLSFGLEKKCITVASIYLKIDWLVFSHQKSG